MDPRLRQYGSGVNRLRRRWPVDAFCNGANNVRLCNPPPVFDRRNLMEFRYSFQSAGRETGVFEYGVQLLNAARAFPAEQGLVPVFEALFLFASVAIGLGVWLARRAARSLGAGVRKPRATATIGCGWTTEDSCAPAATIAPAPDDFRRQKSARMFLQSARFVFVGPITCCAVLFRSWPTRPSGRRLG
jgi:hypothetical protein